MFAWCRSCYSICGRGDGRARPLSAPVARVGACGAMAKYDEKLYTPALVKEVQMLIDQGMRTGQVSGSWHKIKAEFTAAKVGWYGRVSPLKAAISRRNRYGLGVTGSDAQAHGEQMISVGFHSVEDACAFEADPGDKEQQVFEDALCKRSGGTIPPWRTPL